MSFMALLQSRALLQGNKPIAARAASLYNTTRRLIHTRRPAVGSGTMDDVIMPKPLEPPVEHQVIPPLMSHTYSAMKNNQEAVRTPPIRQTTPTRASEPSTATHQEVSASQPPLPGAGDDPHKGSALSRSEGIALSLFVAYLGYRSCRDYLFEDEEAKKKKTPTWVFSYRSARSKADEDFKDLIAKVKAERKNLSEDAKTKGI